MEFQIPERIIIRRSVSCNFFFFFSAFPFLPLWLTSNTNDFFFIDIDSRSEFIAIVAHWNTSMQINNFSLRKLFSIQLTSPIESSVFVSRITFWKEILYKKADHEGKIFGTKIISRRWNSLKVEHFGWFCLGRLAARNLL
jgi:hypothetical protein